MAGGLHDEYNSDAGPKGRDLILARPITAEASGHTHDNPPSLHNVVSQSPLIIEKESDLCY
jgi:hypothetical protein